MALAGASRLASLNRNAELEAALRQIADVPESDCEQEINRREQSKRLSYFMRDIARNALGPDNS